MTFIYNSIFFLLFVVNIYNPIKAYELDFEAYYNFLIKSYFHNEGELSFDKPYIFVSLGCNCWPALALRAHGLRDTAFPFDWLLTPDDRGLVRCLEEQFDNFLNESYLIRELNGYTKVPTDIEHRYYNFRFTHDWPYNNNHTNNERYAEQLAFMKSKYTRRITRFDHLRNFTGKVFFLRAHQVDPHYQGAYGWNKEKTQNLYNALKRFFPELNFTLIILSYTDPTIPEIGDLKGVKEYKIRNSTSGNFFQTVDREYKQMFTELLGHI